jgi:hypothetical protein
MSKILTCWLGATDLKAKTQEPDAGLGPIAKAAVEENFEHGYILLNYQDKETSSCIYWLEDQNRACLQAFNMADLNILKKSGKKDSSIKTYKTTFIAILLPDKCLNVGI